MLNEALNGYHSTPLPTWCSQVRDLRRRLEKTTTTEGVAATPAAQTAAAPPPPSTPALPAPAEATPSAPSDCRAVAVAVAAEAYTGVEATAPDSARPTITTGTPTASQRSGAPQRLLVRSDSSVSATESPMGSPSFLPPRHPPPVTPGRPGTMTAALFSPKGTAAFGQNTVTVPGGGYNLGRRRPSGMPEIGRNRFGDDSDDNASAAAMAAAASAGSGPPPSSYTFHTAAAALSSGSGHPLTPPGKAGGGLATIAETMDSDGILRHTYRFDDSETGDSESLGPALLAARNRRNSGAAFSMHQRETVKEDAEGEADEDAASIGHGGTKPSVYSGATQKDAVAVADFAGLKEPSNPEDSSLQPRRPTPPAGIASANPFARRSSRAYNAMPSDMAAATAAAATPTAAGVANPFARRSSVAAGISSATASGENPFARRSSVVLQSNAVAVGATTPVAAAATAENPFSRRSSVAHTTSATSAASSAGGAAENPFARRSSVAFQPKEVAAGMAAAAGTENPFARRSSVAFSAHSVAAAMATEAAAAKALEASRKSPVTSETTLAHARSSFEGASS